MLTITKHKFSLTNDDKNAVLIRMKNDNMTVDLTNWGASIVSIIVPDKKGNYDDVVLGFSDAVGYENNSPSFGSVVGRYANRIKGGTFNLNNKTYTLEKNDGENTLHGGNCTFVKRPWNYEIKDNKVIFTIESKDMEGGFPGNLTVKVQYTLENTSLRLDYSAVSDKDTVINLTNHSYFNLCGHNKGDILSHFLKINSDYILESDQFLIPTGHYIDVTNTPFDFREFTQIGKRIDEDHIALQNAKGYDHNYVLKQENKEVKEAAVLFEESTGRVMTVYTDLPGVQLYTSNFLNSVKGKENTVYQKRTGVCLETQFFPDSPNHKEFPSCILNASKEFNSTTIFDFSVKM